MQFVISFNEVDTDARFHGLRKLELDMPRTDPSYLRQRVALTYLRALGVPAQCANSGRLVINGAYYGLFTNMERPDVEFVQRLFPGQAGRRPVGRRLGTRDQRGHRFAAAPAARRVESRDGRGVAGRDRGHGRDAGGVGGRGDDRRRGWLLDRKPELPPLRSSDARLAVDSARPRRHHRLGRGASIRSTTGDARRSGPGPGPSTRR